MKVFERIDWEAADPDQYEYQRAATGRLSPLPVEFERIGRMFGAAGLEVVSRAAAQVIDFKMTLPTAGGDRPKRADDWQSADEVVAEFLGPHSGGEHRNRLWHVFMTAALALAKQDVRYWGVTNPRTHRWCAQCRTVQPVGEYSHSEYRCNKHFRRKHVSGKTEQRSGRRRGKNRISGR